MGNAKRLTEAQAWKALKMHYEEIKGAHLRQLFADDSKITSASVTAIFGIRRLVSSVPASGSPWIPR